MDNNDLIRRGDAVKVMEQLEADDDEVYGCHIVEGFDGERAAQALMTIPAVDAVEVVHGEWLPPKGQYHWYKATCSVCGYEDEQSGGDAETLAEYHRLNYCPRCGARMDGQRREEGDA